MNPIIQALHDRKSTRAYLDKPVAESDQDLILDAAIQAPSAGNQILYTILQIDDQELKDELAILCDHQPFIAKAPFVLVFLADCRKWLDGYAYAGIAAREPGLGDMLLGCEDAMVAAENAVIAAESLGIGSCYIGDILENKERVCELLNLDAFVLPITMVVFGYPTRQQAERKKPERFNRKYIVQKNRYSRMSESDISGMLDEVHTEAGYEYKEFMRKFCERKYMSDFAKEMNRSVREYARSFMSTAHS